MPEWFDSPWVYAPTAIAGAAFVYGIVRGSIALGEWIGAVNSDRAAFKEFMSRIEGKIDRIFERLAQPQTSERGSPIRLTDFGKQISRELQVKAWVSAQVAALLTQAQGKQDYEVYDLCTDHVQSRVDEEKTLRDAIRANAYQHGIDMAQVQRVYVIELRDAILKHLQIG